MVQKAFLNTNDNSYLSSISTHVELGGWYEIKIRDCAKDIYLTSTENSENDLYKLNTLIEVITNLRDRYLFLVENEKKINKKYKTQEEAQQFLNYLKEKDNLFFEKYKIETIKNKEKTSYCLCAE